MFDYNKKKYRFLKSVKGKETSILDRPEFMYPESGKKDEAEKPEVRRVNYLRKARSEMGTTALIAAALAVTLSVLVFYLMVETLGNPPLYVSAIAASAALFALFSIVCALLSILEKHKDHRFAVIGLSMGGTVLITWIITVMVGQGA